MKASGLRPISTSLGQRIALLKISFLPLVVFIGAMLGVGILWRDWAGPPTLVGQVEGALANVSSYQAGVVVGLRVARFQKVRAGESIGSVMIADPKLVEASLTVIRAELDHLWAGLDPIATQQRNAVHFARLRLDWMRQRVELATARVNLHLAEAEHQRVRELFQSQIASQSVLDTAQTGFAALQKQVEELTRLVAEGEESFVRLQAKNATDLARISDEPMRTAIAVQEAKLRLTETELSPVQLVAPIDGTITVVHLRTGEIVTPGQPIVTITADAPTRIVGYVRQSVQIAPPVGAPVQVRSRSGGAQRLRPGFWRLDHSLNRYP